MENAGIVELSSYDAFCQMLNETSVIEKIFCVNMDLLHPLDMPLEVPPVQYWRYWTYGL